MAQVDINTLKEKLILNTKLGIMFGIQVDGEGIMQEVDLKKSVIPIGYSLILLLQILMVLLLFLKV